ncbi:LacI family DNA-binding transcriptional regulator [Schaalia sp. 19OD2882]|uniref:LacI family DNA-binding transcriptional regulator n=1 Tax=Schaalia sp. 19OD2882 TaxID=2794089 RepID=UPI001C1E99C9|nr:LacI family DNA-binding transcriptional regulator [Schaalia sp. 19OD2882]QWW19016.1 LacI family DNA-binding transcriptional regulator [Schaalia sp. 19OD2882]
MTKNRTRMTDIAAHAGVSMATVSRVINGTGQVSEDTRHRVLVAIDSLGYERPTLERPGGTRTIGLVVPELVNPIFASFSHALQIKIARAGGLPLVCTQTPSGTSEAEYVNALVGYGVSGFVFVSGRHADHLGDTYRYVELRERGIPFVTINGARQGIEAPDFSTGDALGIRTAVEHLVALGHTRISLLGGKSHIVPAERKVKAFTEVMRDLLGQAHPSIVETFYTYEAAAAAMKTLVTQGTTAVVCGSDLQALGAIRTLHALGLDIPGDVSVVGFDDTRLMAHVFPALTTVRQPVQAITSAAAQTLFAMIDEGQWREGHFEYTPDLVVRRSTGPAPGRSRSRSPHLGFDNHYQRAKMGA